MNHPAVGNQPLSGSAMPRFGGMARMMCLLLAIAPQGLESAVSGCPWTSASATVSARGLACDRFATNRWSSAPESGPPVPRDLPGSRSMNFAMCKSTLIHSVIPQPIIVLRVGGEILLETPEGRRSAPLVPGQSETRQLGVKHNVINPTAHDCVRRSRNTLNQRRAP